MITQVKEINFRLAEYIENLKPSATEAVDNQIKRMKRAGVKDIISFGVGEPCFDTPAIIVEAAQHALAKGETRYQPTHGSFELREELIKKLKNDNHISVGLDDVMVTPGAKFGIFLFFQSILEPGDQVIVLDPAWVSHAAIPAMMGAEVVHIALRDDQNFQPDPDEIRRAVTPKTRCIIINSPCNPTGVVYPPALIREITAFAREKGIIVLSDEIYEKLLFSGENYSPASEFDNVVTINGFSKTYAMTGWRLGYAVAPKKIMEGMDKIYQHSASCVTAFAQAGAIEALRNPIAAMDSARMIEAFRKKNQLMLGLINESKYLKAKPAQGAFYYFPSYDNDKDSITVSQELLEQVHVGTVPGIAFGDCGEKHFRLSYATTDENIIEGMHRIEEYFRSKK